jgi:transposase
MSVFDAVDLDLGRIIMGAAPAANRWTFLSFLQVLQEEYRDHDHLFIVLDGASYHHLSPEVYNLLYNAPTIEFVYLPPCSPELNPAEYPWRMTKAKIAANYYEDIFSLVGDVMDLDGTFIPGLCGQYTRKWQNLIN